MYTERISPLSGFSHLFLSLPYRRNQICIHGNESDRAGKNRAGSIRRNAASCTGAQRVKMKWPERINNCTKGTSKIEMGRTRAAMHKLSRNGFRGPTAGRRVTRVVLFSLSLDRGESRSLPSFAPRKNYLLSEISTTLCTKFPLFSN